MKGWLKSQAADITQKSDRGSINRLTTGQKEQKKRLYKESNKLRWFNFKWKSEARQVIEDKIKHFTETGNFRKLDIYQRKLEDNKSVVESLKALFHR